MSPSWLITSVDFRVKLDILFQNAVGRGFAMIEMSEGSVVVAVARIMAPSRLISYLLFKLNIFLDNTVWGSLSVIEVGEWTIIV